VAQRVITVIVEILIHGLKEVVAVTEGISGDSSKFVEHGVSRFSLGNQNLKLS
jgi:hypothetical protein